MKKIKYFGVCIILVLLSVILINNVEIEDDIDNLGTGFIEESSAIVLVKELENRIAISSPVNEAYPNYPDNYGGAYYNGQQLCICLTKVDYKSQKYYMKYFDDISIIKFKQVKYSYNELLSLLARISKWLTDTEQRYLLVDTTNNCVDVGIPYEKYENIKECIHNDILNYVDDEDMVKFHKEAKSDVLVQDIVNPYPELNLTQDEIEFTWTLENLNFRDHLGSDRTIIYTCSKENLLKIGISSEDTKK